MTGAERTPWWQWPKRPGRPIEPWYVIARRLVVLPVYVTGFALLLAAVVIGWGMKAAMDFAGRNWLKL